MQAYESPIGAKVQGVVFDCEAPKVLAEFYAKLLGGIVEEGPYEDFAVKVPGLGIDLGFQLDEDYERPVFLGGRQDQQTMLHLDIEVNNREEAIQYALSLGATLPKEQFCQPDWDVQWTTLLDPSGHPFCVFNKTYT